MSKRDRVMVCTTGLQQGRETGKEEMLQGACLHQGLLQEGIEVHPRGYKYLCWMLSHWFYWVFGKEHCNPPPLESFWFLQGRAIERRGHPESPAPQPGALTARQDTCLPQAKAAFLQPLQVP